MRTITIYSSTGKSSYAVESDATLWKDLQVDMAHAGVDFKKSSMKAVVGETRVTLESDNAVLIDGPFTLFLMPVKTKSGADRKAIMEEIKSIIAKNPSKKDFFKVGKLNMTQLPTDKLIELLNKYSGNNAAFAPAPEMKQETKAEKKQIAAVVTSVKIDAKQKVIDDFIDKEIDDIATVVTLSVYSEEFVEDDLRSDLKEFAYELVKLVKDLSSEPVPTTTFKVDDEKQKKLEAEERAREEKRKKDAELRAAAENLARDFNDVNCC